MWKQGQDFSSKKYIFFINGLYKLKREDDLN